MGIMWGLLHFHKRRSISLICILPCLYTHYMFYCRHLFAALSCLILIIGPTAAFAQPKDTTTIYYDEDWQTTTKQNAFYYRKAWKNNKDSLWTLRDYYPDHALQMTGYTYDPGTFISEGHTVYYAPNGQKTKECDYKQDKITGLCRTWYYYTGSLKDSGYYVNDTMTGIWHEWYDNGKLNAMGAYNKGKETGTWKIWHDNGQLADSGFYADGERSGIWHAWHENGKPAAVGNYNKGNASGIWKGWYDNGQMDYVAKYVNGEPDSTGTWYFKNGRMSAQEYYDRGILISKKYWDENGKEVPVKNAGDRTPCFVDETNTALTKYLLANTRYPKEARKMNITGQVIVKFLVNEEGRIDDISIDESVNPLLDAEALRVVRSMPNWVPGRQHNRPVSVYYTLPVTFRLE